MYVLLNLAVGGNWPGNPDSTTDWSKSHLLVDYVHIYSNPGAGGSTPGPTPSPIPKPIPTPTPGARTDLSVGNAENPLDPAGAVDIAVTGANTLTTYKIPMFNVTNKVATVTAAFDGHDKLILINASAWNAVKNAIVTFAPGNGATIRNFVDVELTSGGANDTVNIVGMKRGTIATGGGDDSLAITGFSNSHRNNLSKVLAGLGDDAINYTGGGLNKILLDGGDGGDRITAAGRSTGTVLGGRGNDTLAIHSTGEIKLTGGSGADAFVFGKNADATVTDFVAGVDHVQLIGVGLANVHTSWAGADTLIDLGGGASVRLVGVALTQSQINIHFG
jgi:hypothetical protein